ncbi:MAG TPA: phage portal protein [Kiloniellaceae bacterium]|nr:phage portal protein [Kiloniellaceae bacterium]
MTKANLLDRAIAYVSPRAGAERVARRAMMERIEAFGGGEGRAWRGGDPGNRALASIRATRGDANRDDLPTAQRLRENVRAIDRNSAMGGAVIERTVSFAVGTGLHVIPQIDRDFLGLRDDQAEAFEQAASREFNLWAESEYSDAEHSIPFVEQQDLALTSVMVSGDTFGVWENRAVPGWPYLSRLRLYEADQISNPNLQPDGAELAAGAGKGHRVFGGIEIDRNGAHTAVHIRDRHPGAFLGAGNNEWSRVPMVGPSGLRQVLHLYRKRRPGSVRGLPLLAPVVEELQQLSDYTKAELFAAVISAMIAVVHKGKPNEKLPAPGEEGGTELANEDPGSINFEAGMVLDIDADDDVEVPSLGRPNSAFEPFFTAIVRQIGARTGIPYELLIMHFSASYSASRGALEVAFIYLMRWRKWLERHLCAPAYGRVIAEAVAAGRLDAPGFFGDPLVRRAWLQAVWIGPAKISLNPKVEAEAAAIEEDRAWKTSTEITAERTGGQFHRKVRQRRGEELARREAGIAPAPAKSPPPVPRDDGEDE